MGAVLFYSSWAEAGFKFYISIHSLIYCQNADEDFLERDRMR